jgi:RNA polymerase sigma-70 factor (ECF subfamily)
MTLSRRLEAALRATPGVSANSEPFAAALREKLASALDPDHELAELHVEDLYLAWALERGDKAAFARFEREFLSQLSSQIKGAAAEQGELEQLVRTRLFVSADGQSARISQYSGRGPFGGWLRMIATRCLLDLQRARNGHKQRELDSPSVPTDPELDYLKLRYAKEFKLALEAALEKLDARQITLLKLSFIEQVPASVIGVMYSVSGRTVQRWLSDLRASLLAATRENLRASLGLSPSELDSLLGLVDSQLQVSLYRVLGEAPGG